jgi:hypothetical protein
MINHKAYTVCDIQFICSIKGVPDVKASYFIWKFIFQVFFFKIKRMMAVIFFLAKDIQGEILAWLIMPFFTFGYLVLFLFIYATKKTPGTKILKVA